MTQIFLKRFPGGSTGGVYLICWRGHGPVIYKESSGTLGDVYEAAVQAYPGPVPAHLLLLSGSEEASFKFRKTDFSSSGFESTFRAPID